MSTETTETTRNRETVETELQRVRDRRDELRRELNETREKLTAGRADEADAVADAARSDKAPKSGNAVSKLEDSERQLERQRTALNDAVRKLELELGEIELHELEREAKQAGEYAQETFWKRKAAREENQHANARAEDLRAQVQGKRSNLKKKARSRSAEQRQQDAHREAEKPRWRPENAG